MLGSLARAQGVQGPPHEFTDRHAGLVRRLGFLDGYDGYDGYEVDVSAALIVPAFALFAAAGSRRSG